MKYSVREHMPGRPPMNQVIGSSSLKIGDISIPLKEGIESRN
jgi:hypothetical protein